MLYIHESRLDIEQEYISECTINQKKRASTANLITDLRLLRYTHNVLLFFFFFVENNRVEEKYESKQQ